MSRASSWALIALVVGVAAAAEAFIFRREVALLVFALLSPPPPLVDPADEGPRVEWFDDYYTVERIDEATFAIGEPRYYQANYSYLILGRSRAVLFDAGAGVRDIRPVVDSLTDLPVTMVPSHLHYDHVGSIEQFERIAMIDLPALRAQVEGDVLRPTRWQHLGFLEDRPVPAVRVTEWWEPGSYVDLGGRSLEVVHTPGHTPESMSLLDRERRLLFSGDFVNQGVLMAFLPGGDLQDYLDSTDAVLPRITERDRLYTGHRAGPPGAPVMSRGDVADLRALLLQIRAGEADGDGYPVTFRVNDRLILIADLPAGVRWR